MQFNTKKSVYAVLALTAYQSNALIPVRDVTPETLHTRSTGDTDHILRPRSSVLSQYIHEGFGPGYTVSVTHSHDNLHYVDLDDFESLGGKLSCEHDSQVDKVSTVKASFARPDHFSKARDFWVDGSDLIFSTVHPSCDTSGERSFFRLVLWNLEI